MGAPTPSLFPSGEDGTGNGAVTPNRPREPWDLTPTQRAALIERADLAFCHGRLDVTPAQFAAFMATILPDYSPDLSRVDVPALVAAHAAKRGLPAPTWRGDLTDLAREIVARAEPANGVQAGDGLLTEDDCRELARRRAKRLRLG